MRNSIVNFLKSFSFFNGILKTISVLSCLFLGWICNDFYAGITGALTIIMISPSDIPGNRKHHLGGIAIATFFVIISSVCINLTQHNLFLLLPSIFILVFIYAYISLYGNRASMVAIAGIFSISLTFARLKTDNEIFYNALYSLLAGMGYIALVQIYMLIKPRQYSEQLLGKCMALTANFFQIKNELLLKNNSFENKQKLLNLQTSLNEEFEKLREILLDFGSKSGKTNYLQRQFLIFIELIDIFEWIMATPTSFEKNESFPEEYSPILEKINTVFTAISSNLIQFSEYIGFRKKITQPFNFQPLLKEIKNEIEQLSTPNSQQKIVVQNLYQYLNTLSEKIQNIQHIVSNYYTEELSYRDQKSYRKFVTIQNYSLKRLLDHWSMQSPIFRHALRLATISIIGFSIGNFFKLQNSYWILFTIYVIMRPGYATTKKRSKDRAWGTIIGGAIAGIIIFFCQHLLKIENYSFIYGVIIVFCMPFAYGLLQENFSLCVVFITLYITLIYAIFIPNAIEILQFRIIDTMIGVFLSLAASHWLFPSWENQQQKSLILNTLKSTITYISAISVYYENPKNIKNNYKIFRKKAFLDLANLNAGFQRMLQEPKSQQKKHDELNRFMVVMQDFLGSAVAITVQLDTEKHQNFPTELFSESCKKINFQLKKCILFLENKSDFFSSEKTHFELIRNQYINTNSPDFYAEQLLYLYHLSHSLNNIVKEM